MITIQKINQEKVKPIPLEVIPKDKIKGSCLFENIYANIFIVARKKSGKTSVIFKIIKSCTGKKTKFFIFSSTIHKDATWIHIVKFLRKRNNEVHTYTSIKEGGNDELFEILKSLQVEDKEEEKPKPNLLFPQEKDKKDKKENKISAEHLFIFDDIGSELALASVTELLKTNRHYLSKCIISSQHVNDLKPAARKQIDYWLLFKGHKEEKLEIIYKDADINIPFELFHQLYLDATKEKYNFLYIDTNDMSFRKNFNMQYNLPSSDFLD